MIILRAGFVGSLVSQCCSFICHHGNNFFLGFPTRFPHRKPVCVCATGSAGSCQGFISTADSREITQFRCLLGGILQELDRKGESVAFSEIIGVVLDGDAPSAPAGIPTCPHTAFVTAPAGIFLSSSHHSAYLIKFLFLSREIGLKTLSLCLSLSGGVV